MMCHLFIGKKLRKKFTHTPALYPSSKNTDSGQPEKSPPVEILPGFCRLFELFNESSSKFFPVFQYRRNFPLLPFVWEGMENKTKLWFLSTTVPFDNNFPNPGFKSKGANCKILIYKHFLTSQLLHKVPILSPICISMNRLSSSSDSILVLKWIYQALLACSF